MGKRKFSFRTALLMMVALELCLLFCLVDQKARFLWNRGDKSRVLEKDKEFGIYLFTSLASDLVAMICAAAIILSSTVKWFKWKKMLVIIVLGINFILVLPVQTSGFVLYFETVQSYRTSVSMELEHKFQDFIASPANVTTLPEELVIVQNETCCCGLTNHTVDYQSKAVNTTDFCPMKKCPHKKGHFLGCSEAVPAKLRLFILVSCSIGLFACILAMLVTPFIYVYFEKDRREGRAQYLRDWQKTIHKEMEQKRLLFGEKKTSTTTTTTSEQ